jgi:hypothetical protein
MDGETRRLMRVACLLGPRVGAVAVHGVDLCVHPQQNCGLLPGG